MASEDIPRDQESSSANKRDEHELVRRLPEETQPAEEWGERLATGKAIATGGKQGTEGARKGGAVKTPQEAEEREEGRVGPFPPK